MITNTFESGSDGTTISIANSASPDPISAAPTTTAATVTFTAAEKQKGSLSLKMQYANVAGQAGVQFTQTAATSTAVRFYMKLGSYPTTSAQGLFTLTSSTVTSFRASLAVDNAGRLALFDFAGGYASVGGDNTFAGAGSMAVDTWYRVEVGLTVGSGTGAAEIKCYKADSLTPEANLSWNTTNKNYGGSAINYLLLGRWLNSNPAANGTLAVYYDDVAWETGSATLLGPSTVPTNTIINYVKRIRIG